MKATELQIDPNANLKADSFENSKHILEEGFDSQYPIVADQDGLIIDGNHRYKLFKEANRLKEVEVLVIDWRDFDDLVNKEINNGTLDKFENNDEYFYKRVKEVANQ